MAFQEPATTALEERLASGPLDLRALHWPGDGASALLVHATSFCADVWVPAWEEARACGAGCLDAWAIDQPGHGQSTEPANTGGFGWDRLARDLWACLERFQDPRGVWLLGHSSGAAVCLAAAGMEPHRVAGVAVVEPVLYDRPENPAADSFAGSRALAERARKRRSGFSSKDEARVALGARFPYSGFESGVLEAYLEGGFAERADGTLTLRCRPESEARAYEGAARLDLWRWLPAIEAPILVVRAEHSAIPAPLLERLSAQALAVEVETVSGSTHFALLEKPLEVGRSLGAFISRTALRGS